MKQRIITGLIAGSLFIGLTIVGGWYYYAMLVLLAFIGFFEYVRMFGLQWNSPFALTGFVGVAFIMFPWQKLHITKPSLELVIWALLFILLTFTVWTKNRIKIDDAALVLLGVFYVGFGFLYMNEVRNGGHQGFLLTVFTFCTIWASDIGAYFTGKMIGKHKLWPAISPNKTIEGSLGGVVWSIVVALLFAYFAPHLVAYNQAIIIGLIAAVAGQLGDLIQSAYKRVRDIKDTGNLLPGHGGILDRCDSWLIVFPLLVLSGILPLS